MPSGRAGQSTRSTGSSLFSRQESQEQPRQKEHLVAERTVTIASTHGLHARPASLFVQAVNSSGLAVELTKGEKTLNASSILGVISLGINQGDEITLRADGDNAEQVLDELVTFLTTDHDA
jgi:phosphocarrier protein